MKVVEQYFPVVLFIMCYYVESEEEILKCDHSNDSYEQYFSVVLFIMYALQGGSHV